MLTTAKLAGFFAAHAIWSVSDGETLVPMFAYIGKDDKTFMDRLVIEDDLEKSVAYGRTLLESNERDANDAVLAFDGRIPLGETKSDAIILELRAYFAPDARVVIAVPYTPKSAGAFRVHKPKLVTWQGCEDVDMQAALEAFFVGVNSHEEGGKVWSACLDESK